MLFKAPVSCWMTSGDAVEFKQTMPVSETKRSIPISMPTRHLFVVITIIYRKVWATRINKFHFYLDIIRGGSAMVETVIQSWRWPMDLIKTHHKVSSEVKTEKHLTYTCMYFFILKKKCRMASGDAEGIEPPYPV